MENNIKAAVFGGTGFIGSYILKELSINSIKINLLVRNGSENKIPKINNLNIIRGDLSDLKCVDDTIEDCEFVIYAVGIIRENRKIGLTFEKLHYEYFKDVVDTSKKHAVKKIIYISANGVNANGTKYQTTKYRAEQYLKNNFKQWTIYRPSIVFGDPEGKIEFITQLRQDIIEKPIPVPLFFRSNPIKYKTFFKSNPVHVENLSSLIVTSLGADISKNKIYKVGGLDEITWVGMLKKIIHVLSKRKLFIPVPIIFIQIFSYLLDWLPFFPITVEQIKMLKQDNICNSEDLFKQYKIIPIKFSCDSIKYLDNNL